MSRLIMSVIALLLLNSISFAKKEPTTKYQDGILADSASEFSLLVDQNWKVKSFKEPNIERAFLQKKNYSVNPMIKTYGGDYTVPTIIIFAQEFEASLADFEALLKKSLTEHNSDNAIINKLGLLMDGEFVTSGETVIDSNEVRHIILKRNYQRLLSSDALISRNPSPKAAEQYINDHEIHEIFLVKKNSRIILIQAFCEREFYQENSGEFLKIVSSLQL